MYDYDYDDAMDDARDNADSERWDGLVQEQLSPLVEEVMLAVEATDEEQPHPWTWERHLLQTWLNEGEDALREELEEHFREEAEEAARDSYEPGPCCNEFSCPCGNSNNFRGL